MVKSTVRAFAMQLCGRHRIAGILGIYTRFTESLMWHTDKYTLWLARRFLISAFVFNCALTTNQKRRIAVIAGAVVGVFVLKKWLKLRDTSIALLALLRCPK